MRHLAKSLNALKRRAIARTGTGGQQHRIRAMSTTQVSEFAQRQLAEGVIDMAAGQVGDICQFRSNSLW